MEIKINMKSLKLIIRNMQIKTTLRYNFHLTDGQKSRNSLAYSNDKPVRKQYSQPLLMGPINWYKPHVWQCDNIPQNYKYSLTLQDYSWEFKLWINLQR